jgi:hypothetical protein
MGQGERVTYKWIAGAALIALVPMPAQAAAQDTATQNDIQCVAALSVAASQAKGDKLTGLAMITFYFVGRLDGRVPTLDLENELAHVAKDLTDAKVKTLLADCGAQYLRRANEMQAIGKSLEGRAPQSSSSS